MGCLVQRSDSVEWEVDVVGSSGGSPCLAPKDDDPDATEYSSSFGNTLSGSVDESKVDLSDFEADSPFCAPTDCLAAGMDDINNNDKLWSDRFPKRKKATEHWRNFIVPLTWRCQWLELRMTELRSQVAKYDKELSVLRQEKDLHLKMIELDSSSSRTMPFCSQSIRKKPMKRRKRNKKEEAFSMVSYYSNHNVFSYYENKKAEVDALSVGEVNSDKDEKMKRENNVNFLVETKKADPAVDQILQTIEALEEQVGKLRSQLKVAMSKTKGVADVPKLEMNDSESSTCSDEKDVDDIGSPSRTISDLDVDDMYMPDSAVSSYGDAADLDVVESTLGLVPSELSHQLREFYNEGSDDVLIDNHRAEGQFQNFELPGHPRKHPNGSVKEELSSQSEGESSTPGIVIRELHHGNGMEVEPLEAAPKLTAKGKRRGRPRKKRPEDAFAAQSTPVNATRKKDISVRKWRYAK